jgi:transcriptional regulator GlxA family with amidase domain
VRLADIPTPDTRTAITAREVLTRYSAPALVNHCHRSYLLAASRAALDNLDVDLEVLYVEDDRVITSAGTAAGIDACLHLVRTELGSEVATRIARRMVVPPHRSGGQRQFVETPVPTEPCEGLQDVMEWVAERLDEEHSIPSLARRAAMSERTFARRFTAEVGTTPHKWLTSQRVLRARHLLESTDLDIERIARESGFATAAVLRHHFQRQIGIPPVAYRRAFARQPVTA